MEVWSKQKEIESTLQEVSSKQQEAIEIVKTIRSKQEDVKHKQEDVKTTLGEAIRRIPVAVAKHFPIKVLLWNIGTKDPEIRECLVTGMVERVDPDVLLLQEVMSQSQLLHKKKKKHTNLPKTITQIKDSSKKKYEWLEQDMTGILYDNGKYELIQEDFDEVIRVSKENLVPNKRWKPDKNKDDEMTMRELFDTRMKVACLQIRGTTQRVIFLSFHNGYKYPYKKEGAVAFCELVLEIQRQTKCFVVGGADLNCQLSTNKKSRYGTVKYELTERRSALLMVDYFVIGPSGTAKEASVKAFNPDIHDRYTTDECKAAVDHDPLVCDLTIYLPNDEN